MKTNMYVFVACLATLLFASCSKETSESEPQPSGTVSVELSVKGTQTVNGRATGDTSYPTQATENTIERLVVAVFNKDDGTGKEAVNTIVELSKASDIANPKFNCTAALGCTGLAVANAPKGHFANITTKADFLKKVIMLEATTDLYADPAVNPATKQEAARLPMSGELKDVTTAPATPSVTFDLNGTKLSNPLSVNLSRLVARISINSIKTDFTRSGMYPKATFTLKRVFLRDALDSSQPNVGGYAKTMPTTTPLVYLNTCAPTALTITLADWLKNDEATPVLIPTPADNPAEHTTHYWFYAFANENAAHPTALVLEGAFDPDGPTVAGTPSTGTLLATTIYYPIIINKNQSGTTITDNTTPPGTPVTGKKGTIARNSKYNLSATIKNIGTSYPGGTIDPADLTLAVTVDNWILDIQQDVEFN